MNVQPQLPVHGQSTIAEIMPSVAKLLRPEMADAQPLLNIASAQRYVLVMVDGLGLELLRRHSERVPYLGSLLDHCLALTSAVPSTTATSLTSLGTGLPPGQHGVVGYTFRINGEPLNALAWNPAVPAEQVQTHPTWFSKLAQEGVLVSAVCPAHFEHSGLTKASQRGARFVPVPPGTSRDERISYTVAAATAADQTFVYLYEKELDTTGHHEGCGSVPWRAMLDEIDEYLENLRNSLPSDVCLLITGDHGMIDVPEARQLIIEDQPGLSDGVNMVCGEPRLRQLYTDDPERVAQCWAEVLGERAIVRTREQAIREGWWGEVDDRVSSYIGDVLVACLDDWALLSLNKPGELTLVGQHGSLTPNEMRIPLLIDAG